ncbi:DUF4407 domain-containing protein [Massilia glaciei]|uniref:DUF4407 domain-containing protein n=1 Tax=Massilia glaciei TaxID=1524097 RepID=A0A2U2HLE8_9BURK|nr:DUF4407 domain-containing protein [Massilia glaciei]PWF48351.1 DUF4407 domain-containing protein [Massilia glaciei]
MGNFDNEQHGPSFVHRLLTLFVMIASFIARCFKRAGVVWARLLRSLVGVDRRLMATSSKSLQSTFHALALLMVGTAMITAGGITFKLSQAFGFGLLANLATFAFVFSFAAALECAILGTLMPGNPLTKAIVVRIGAGLLITAMQVVPILTLMMHDRINLALHSEGVASQLVLKAQNESLSGMAAIQDRASKLEDGEERARAEFANPPRDPEVEQANDKLSAARSELSAAQADLAALRLKASTLAKAAVASDKDEKRRGVRIRALEAVQAKMRTAAAAINRADVAVQEAEGALKSRQAAQVMRLQQSVTEASTAVSEHAKHVKGVASKLEGDASVSRDLVERANKPNFISQTIALFKLAARDLSVAAACLAFYLAALLIDTLPLMVKMSMKDNQYARRLMAREDDQEFGEKIESEVARLDGERILSEKTNELNGVRKFAEQDAGAYLAQKLAFNNQLMLDITTATQSMQVTEAAADRLRGLMFKLLEIDKLVAAHPNVKSVYTSQLAVLLSELRERAADIDRALRKQHMAGGAAT